MEMLIDAAIGLGGMVLVCVFIGPLRDVVARRRTRRIARGKPVSFAARVSVDGGRLRHARLTRSGDTLRVRCWRGGFRIPLADGTWVTRHQEDSSDPVADWLLVRHTDPDGRVVDVGTMLEDRRAVAALRAAPTAPRPRVFPGTAAAASLLVLGAVLISVLYAVSYDATATVRAVNPDASSCLVQWQQGARTRLTHVDCGSYDAAVVGLTLPIVAQPEPFADQAFSGERNEALPIDGVILAAVLLVLGFGVWRARGPRHPVLLTPVPVKLPGAGGPVGAGQQATPGDPAVLGLAAQATAVEGWPQRWVPYGGTVSVRRDLVGALTTVGWWTPVLFLAAAAVGDPRGLGTALWVATAVAVVVQCGRVARAWTVLHRLWRLPLSSEWDGVGLPGPDGYAVLLCLGRTPHWLVEVGTMPPVSARMRMRGEPADGTVHLVPSTGDGVLLGSAQRYTDELDDDVCGFLRSLLADPAEADSGVVDGPRRTVAG